mmetsp:Transcript_12197/g.30928  ORF Transcript_12197/g.30928 Transcript_12197/m.30928 type:complete len:261 (+) Transcript_12197:303-1085(+)
MNGGGAGQSVDPHADPSPPSSSLPEEAQSLSSAASAGAAAATSEDSSADSHSPSSTPSTATTAAAAAWSAAWSAVALVATGGALLDSGSTAAAAAGWWSSTRDVLPSSMSRVGELLAGALAVRAMPSRACTAPTVPTAWSDAVECALWLPLLPLGFEAFFFILAAFAFFCSSTNSRVCASSKRRFSFFFFSFTIAVPAAGPKDEWRQGCADSDADSKSSRFPRSFCAGTFCEDALRRTSPLSWPLPSFSGTHTFTPFSLR